MRWCICVTGRGVQQGFHMSSGKTQLWSSAVALLSLTFSWTPQLQLLSAGPVSAGLSCCLKVTWEKGELLFLVWTIRPKLNEASSRAYSLLVIQTAGKGWMVLLSLISLYLARDFHRSGLCYCNHGNQSHSAHKELAAASCRDYGEK